MTTLERALEMAGRIGASDGKAAASWVFDGNTQTETYQRVLRGIEDGDPEVMDLLPSPDLSGQWSDTRTSAGLLAQVEDVTGVTFEDFDAEEIVRAYEDGFSEGAQDEVERMARYQLDPSS